MGIGILRQELDPLQENAQSYKEKKEAQGQVNKLADQYANLLGHQNHKQKIHHLVRLKQENLDLREENAKLNLDLNKQKRLVSRLKETYKSDKENSNPSLATPLANSMLRTPLAKAPAFTPMSKTPAAFRRQTVASPLANRTGQRN